MSDTMHAFIHRCLVRLHAEPRAACDACDAFDACEQVLGDVTLLPHQVEGARRLRAVLARHGGALLADEVGLGKTYTALAVARDLARVLVVAPAAVRVMWDAASARCGVATTIITYEQLSAGRMPIGGRWDLVILDEAHRTRSPATRRYRALTQLTVGVPVLLLTATPIHNRRRDLDALLSLFLGTGSASIDDATLAALVVRRRVDDVGVHLPSLRPLRRHDVPPAPAVLDALRTLPPPLPPADGGVAQSLVSLQLTRAWCSSDAALASAIRRRLATAAALEHALQRGRLPARRDLAAWTAANDGSVQLAFPELVAAPAPSADIVPLLEVVHRHADALRTLRALVRGEAARDTLRFAHVRRLVAECAGRQVVVFTHSVETAQAAFRALVDTARAALLTGRSASIASGPVTRAELLAAFAPGGDRVRRRDDIARVDVLVASDVLSEGVDLHGADVVIHLDLPWTVARFEQRLGRLRRLGSRHLAVESHLVSPPVDAGELALTLHHLARKARLVTGTVGLSSLGPGADAWDDAASGLDARAPIAARHAMVRALRRLERELRPGGELPHLASPSHVGDSIALPPGSPTHITRCRGLGCTTPLAIALVALDGDVHLAIADGEQVTIEPASVVVTLEALAERVASCALHARSAAVVGSSGAANAGGGGADAASRNDSPHGGSARPVLLPVERALLAWCDEQRARRQLSPDAAHASPGHRRLLRALSSMVARAPRAERPAIARRAADGRRLVLACAGTGVEALFDALLPPRGATHAPEASADHDGAPSHAGPSHGTRADARWLDRVLRTLRDVAPSSPPARWSTAFSSPSHPCIEAILTVLPDNFLPDDVANDRADGRANVSIPVPIIPGRHVDA